MIEQQRDLWNYCDDGETTGVESYDPCERTWLVVTTNGCVKSDGTCVMGRGVAQEARDRFDGIDKRPKNARKTHCPHGHEYSGNNLYVSPKGWRYCRECKKISSREYRRRKKIENISIV